jgi:hypothetical protein
MWVQDPDGLRIVLAEAPADHPSAMTRDGRYRRSDKPHAHHSAFQGNAAAQRLPGRRQMRTSWRLIP